MNIEELDRILTLMQKYGVKTYQTDELKLEIVPSAPPASQTPQTHYPEAQYKEPEMPMSMQMWGGKYNG